MYQSNVVDALMGSFAIGTKLARDARLTLTSKVDPC